LARSKRNFVLRSFFDSAISRVAASLVIIAIIVVAAASGIYFYSIDAHSNSTSVSRSSSTSTSSSSSLISQSDVACTGTSESTYHCDYTRDGYDPNEPKLNNPSVAWASPTLDGAVYAQPLVAFGNVYVATENDSIYALNATNGSIEWRTNVGSPVTSGLPCGDIVPLGITGTPVIDLSSHVIYLVAEVTGGYHLLFGVNVNTGLIVLNRTVDPPNFSDIIAQQQRPALALYDGIVYVEFGGLDGDCSTYHGWVVGAPLNDSSRLYTFEVAQPQGDNEGGIWEVGGVSIAPNGDLYIATGNSANSNISLIDYGDSVVELSPTLQVVSYFAPGDSISLNVGDTDLGSTGPILINDSSFVFQIGKEGVGYLLNPTNLRGYNASLFSNQVCDGAYSADAYYNSTIYVPCTNGLFALGLNGTKQNPTFFGEWNTDSFTSSAPIVAGGAVWSIDTDNATLFALNPSSGKTLYSFNLENVVHFQTVASADGKIFAANQTQIVAISIST
jgi:outer membrane protein assembly factor BamB